MAHTLVYKYALHNIKIVIKGKSIMMDNKPVKYDIDILSCKRKSSSKEENEFNIHKTLMTWHLKFKRLTHTLQIWLTIFLKIKVNSRITELVGDLAERDRVRETNQRDQVCVEIKIKNYAIIQQICKMFSYCKEAKAREQATVGSAEKQKIIMQISAVQTDIKRNLDERLVYTFN